jgi:ubiquinone/menaquinone biosynthesis C-methylase UbiE
MKDNEQNKIEEFWNANPVGSNFIIYSEDKSFYEKYDEFRYRTEGHIITELDKIDFLDQRTLEIGLGQGADSMQLINRGAVYYGVDLTEESVRRVKERFRLFNKPYKEVKQVNAERLPYEDNFFDIVYSHGVIHHSQNIDTIVNEIYRVLKPNGKMVIMLYHKNSFNYYISIAFFRRVGLLLMFPFPFLTNIVSKLTGESKDRILKHKDNLKDKGFSYLNMNNFIHKSTDGPDNVFSSTWSKKSIKILFKKFKEINTDIHFLNERHLLGFQYFLSKSMKNNLERKMGWHLWIKAKK